MAVLGDGMSCQSNFAQGECLKIKHAIYSMKKSSGRGRFLASNMRAAYE